MALKLSVPTVASLLSAIISAAGLVLLTLILKFEPEVLAGKEKLVCGALKSNLEF